MHALALIEAPGHVCGRYRIEPFVGAVESAGGRLSVEALERSPLRRALQLARAGRHDVVLLQRKLLPAWQLAILRKSARRLLFDFDDAVLFRDSNDPRGPRCPRRAARFRDLMAKVDGVSAGNGFLAQLAVDHGLAASRVHQIPTTIRTDAYPAEGSGSNGDGPTFVWIGSSGTLAGLERRREVWEAIGREVVPSCRLKVICDRFPDFSPLRVLAVPWSEATEIHELTTSDVGVSWIPDDLWSRGKCGLKVLQYMAAGLPVLANPVGVHPEMVDPGANGFLVDSREEWLVAARTLAADPTLRAAMGRRARGTVESRYSAAVWAPRFVGFLQGRTGPPPPRPASTRRTAPIGTEASA